jgi:predicted nucleic acid-binding protein
MTCIDAGFVVRRVVFPDDRAVQHRWDRWDQEQTRLVAPSLLYYEVTNALYRYQRQGHLRGETVDVALEVALSLSVELVDDTALHREAKAMAERYGLPATYDAHYLALAERLQVDLWTTDERLLNTLKPFRVAWVRGVR